MAIRLAILRGIEPPLSHRQCDVIPLHHRTIILRIGLSSLSALTAAFTVTNRNNCRGLWTTRSIPDEVGPNSQLDRPGFLDRMGLEPTFPGFRKPTHKFWWTLPALPRSPPDCKSGVLLNELRAHDGFAPKHTRIMRIELIPPP